MTARYPTASSRDQRIDELEAQNSILKAALAVLEATIERVRATTILDGNPRYGTVPVSVLNAALGDRCSPTVSGTVYCGVGSCDNTPGHNGIHRCRCGKPVDEHVKACGWHQTPEASS